ncbi:head GIN domain-containing protein [Methanobacterium alcaliphilum]|uniref:head GIN domain-containing protein n=1 Tax=Methanobacterium alcaliphilum TaxID=392018 RepID=UPI00200B9BC3|nr:head GIN domain-containing protein [Methanobacterium alcaliphilum]MCK9150825.1 DUF2807 domain-containing protein [Methanobacterium alcaliphilum]
MKNSIILVLIICIAITVSGCIGTGGTGSGNVINETKTVNGFDQVSLNGIGTLIITQGSEESLTIEAEDNIIPHIQTKVDDNKLEIYYDNITPSPTKSVLFHITLRDLGSVEMSGAGKLNSTNIKTKDLTLRIEGAGEGEITNLNADNIKINIIGAGNLKLSGNVDNQTININGAGEYNAPALTSKITSITINGFGKGTVNVSTILNAVINGGGSINYFGNPKVNQEINGAGTVNKAF